MQLNAELLMTHIKLKNSIINEARRLGFELVGVTTPNPPAHLEVLWDWQPIQKKS
jgi:hypothetical protein